MPAGFAYTKIFLRGLLDRWNVKPYFFAHKWALVPDNLWQLSVPPAHAPVALPMFAQPCKADMTASSSCTLLKVCATLQGVQERGGLFHREASLAASSPGCRGHSAVLAATDRAGCGCLPVHALAAGDM